MLRVIVAGFHLLGLGLGLGAVLTRGNALREPLSAQSLQRAFGADTLWGIAALLWVVTGVWRLSKLEKGTDYYFANHFFVAKMSLFVLILLLEVWPMIVLIRWRVGLRRDMNVQDFALPAVAKRMAAISHVEALLVVLMVFFAAAMARGYGYSG
jgi:putative membrane protein